MFCACRQVAFLRGINLIIRFAVGVPSDMGYRQVRQVSSRKQLKLLGGGCLSPRFFFLCGHVALAWIPVNRLVVSLMDGGCSDA